MKKAFEQNVSRAKPRLRLGAFTGAVDPTAPDGAEGAADGSSAELEQARAAEPERSLDSEPVRAPEPAPAAHDLSAEVRARIERARAPRPTAAEVLDAALRASTTPPPGRDTQEEEAPARVTVAAVAHSHAPVAQAPAAPVARVEAPEPEVEVQTPAPPREEVDTHARRERLKERLKAVRENPRPEPLPASVAEAGMRAVERISALQTELVKVKAINLTLTQDLEVTRRQAEKATEEARLRMDEARRLATEVEGRVKLLADLERELAALEGERDEALLSLQEARQAMQAAADERSTLEAAVAEAKKALTDSLSEEERLAGELEACKDEVSLMRRTVDTLQGERDVLAQQVASLTAERAELLEARKALEAVHRALSQAVAR
ncbi:extensin-like protein [Cystobacter fuscus]|uniref:extensin-like protein n=1 Tax=Cystobacter fuscus TaxID=43 RepID=UPI002B2E90FA|nr:extensin-like protein [Cystobacter fuscus]